MTASVAAPSWTDLSTDPVALSSEDDRDTLQASPTYTNIQTPATVGPKSSMHHGRSVGTSSKDKLIQIKSEDTEHHGVRVADEDYDDANRRVDEEDAPSAWDPLKTPAPLLHSKMARTSAAAATPGLSSTSKKRRRTTPEQLRVLEDAYEEESKPSVEQRNSIADKTNMTARAVQIWVSFGDRHAISIVAMYRFKS